MIPHSQWKWYGYGGHFTGNAECRFHMSTQIGQVLVSTLGDYYPRGEGGKRVTLGAADDSWFETMIFTSHGEDKAGNPDYGETLLQVRYATSRAAEDGHRSLCEKWAAKQDQPTTGVSHES